MKYVSDKEKKIKLKACLKISLLTFIRDQVIIISMNNFFDIEKIGNILEGKSFTIFNNCNVFSDNFIPDKIISRDTAITTIGKALIPLQQISHLIISGDLGSGKTTIAHLLQNTINDKGIRCIYIKILGLSEYELAKVLVKELTKSDKVERSRQKAWEIIDENINELTYLILDDVIWSPWLVSFINHYHKLISIIIFSESVTIGSSLSNEISSYLPQKIHLPPYRVPDLVNILKYHINDLSGFKEGVIDDAEIGYCAAYIIRSCESNCHTALNIIYNAGLIAQQEGNNTQILDRHIDKALEQQPLQNIDFDDITTNIILILLAKGGDCKMTQVFHFYMMLGRFNIYLPSKSTLWRNLQKMHIKGLIEIISSRGLGKNKLVRLVSGSDLLTVIKKKYDKEYIKNILNLVNHR